jgi:hypothetical protein
MLMYNPPAIDILGELGFPRIHDPITEPNPPSESGPALVHPAHDFLLLSPDPALTADLWEPATLAPGMPRNRAA